MISDLLQMYLKILIPLFSFSLVYCFKDMAYLEKSYMEILENRQIINPLNAKMCEHMKGNGIVEKLLLCQRIFKLLREDTAIENPYRHSVYMNYEAFRNPEYHVCENKNIRIHTSPIETFFSLNCYDQPPITSSEIPPPNDQHLKKISIMNGLGNSMVVSKCDQQNECVIIELYSIKDWRQYSTIPYDIANLDVPVPRTANIEKLRSAFNENLHKVQEMCFQEPNFMGPHLSTDKLNQLCNLLLRRSEYIVKCNPEKLVTVVQGIPKYSSTNVTIFQPFSTIQEIQRYYYEEVNIVHINLLSYSCSRYKHIGRADRNFRIMAGPDDNSVILLEPVTYWYNRKVYLVPVELIENLHWNYVFNFEDWF